MIDVRDGFKFCDILTHKEVKTVIIESCIS